jgi:hypothetical protein
MRRTATALFARMSLAGCAPLYWVRADTSAEQIDKGHGSMPQRGVARSALPQVPSTVLRIAKSAAIRTAGRDQPGVSAFTSAAERELRRATHGNPAVQQRRKQ